MPPCNCGGTRAGYVKVWQLVRVGKPIVEYDEESDARAALSEHGGRLQRVTRRVA